MKNVQAAVWGALLIAVIGAGIGLVWSKPEQTAASPKVQPVIRQFIPPNGPVNHTHVDVYVACGFASHQLDSYFFVPTGFYPPPPGSRAGTMMLVYDATGKPVYDVDYESVRYVYVPGVSQGKCGP